MQQRVSSTNPCPTVRRLEVVNRPIGELSPDPNNARRHDKRQVRKIADSIKNFGFNVPIVIDSNRRVICGHARLLAARVLGLLEVPTTMLEHLSEAQIRAFMIADNRLTEISEWDEKLLAEQLRGLSLEEVDFNLEATGFEMGEIDLLIEGLEAQQAGDDSADALPDEVSGPPVARTGDLWILGRHRVYCGNALEKAAYIALMEAREPRQ